MFRFMGLKKIRYIFLILSVAYLALSINFFINTVLKIGIDPYKNITAAQIIGEEEFLLKVQRESNLHLLHNAEIGTGYVEFRLTGDDGRVISEYRVTGDDFINKVIYLGEGTYLCTISRNVTNYKENLRLYFDKRYIIQEYLREDFKTANSNL